LCVISGIVISGISSTSCFQQTSAKDFSRIATVLDVALAHSAATRKRSPVKKKGSGSTKPNKAAPAAMRIGIVNLIYEN
jgi:hypothetical protein